MALKLRSKNNRPVLMIDFDDVVVQCLDGLVEEWNKMNGTTFKKEDVTSWDIDSCLGKGAHQIFFKEGFFRNLKEKNNAIPIIKELIASTKYDIYIVTACQSAQEISEKLLWIQEKMPDFNLNRFIACKEKHMIRADLIIDDRPANLDSCRKYMECILYDMPHNSKVKKYIRISDFNEVPAILEELFYS